MTFSSATATTLLKWACVALSIFFILSFSSIAFLTLSYPFHLEWMEGHTIDIVKRIVDGKAIYTEPTMEYVPFLYTPYYYYVVAMVSLLTGVDFFPARLVSTLSILASAGIIYAWIRKEGGSALIGIIAAGVLFATYRLSGRWFDVSRIDSFHLLLTLAGLYVFFHYCGRKYALLAGVIFAFDFFTKQSTLIYITPVLAIWLLIDYKHSLITMATLGALIALGVFSADIATHGWFSFYVFEVPAGHSMDKRFIVNFWTHEMLKPLAILFLCAAMLAILLYKNNRHKFFAYGALAIGFILGSYIMRLHYGSYLNVLIPAHAALALLTGLWLRFAESNAKASLISYGLVVIQLAMLLYNPTRYIPSQEAIDTGNRFLEEIGKVDGEVFIPEMQWVQTRVGKRSYAFGMAAYDIFRAELGNKNVIKQKLGAEVTSALRNGQFAGVMPGRIFRLPEKKNLYVFERNIDYPGEYVTGLVKFYKTDLYVRKSP